MTSESPSGKHVPDGQVAFRGASGAPFTASSLMLVAALATTSMNACARLLTAELHPFEIGFFRNAFGLAILAPVVLLHGPGLLRTSQLSLHAMRALLNVLATLLFLLGLQRTNLLTAMALDYSAPLFATVLAIALLRERPGLGRLGALAVGVVGVLIVLRPGLIRIDAGVFFVLGSAATWGITLIVIKVLARKDSSFTTTLYMGAFTTPIALLFAFPVWQMPNRDQLIWLVVMGALNGIGQLCVAQALRQTDLTRILPIDFTKLIWAALLGFVILGETVDTWSWLGGAIIFLAAFYVAATERTATEVSSK